MARNSKNNNQFIPSNLSEQEMLLGISKLERRLKEIEAFNPQNAAQTDDNSLATSLKDKINQTLVDVFGHDTIEYKRYEIFSLYNDGVMSISLRGGSSIWERANSYIKGKQKALSKVQGAISLLQERLDDLKFNTIEQQIPASSAITEKKFSSDIFIVHGHDDAIRESVARFISKAGLNPIILHEQPNRGKTIIEKFEAYHEVGFAIILLTPDDLGKAKNEENLSPRARQNVILELGYFFGKLGRDRVLALKKGNIELPTDIAGIVWEPIELAANQDWQIKIVNELKSAGYDIDLNKVFS